MFLLEVESTTIGSLFQTVTTVINEILKLFTTVGTSLMANPLFQIMLGIVILMIIMSLVFLMVRKVKNRGR